MKLKYILKGSQILLLFYSVIFLILRGALVLTQYFQQLKMEQVRQIQIMQSGGNADMAQIVVENNGGGMALAISLGVAAFLLVLDVWSILEYWIRQKREEWNVRRLYGASELQIYFQMEKYFLFLLLIAFGISWIPFRMMHGILVWMQFPANLSAKEELLLYLGVAAIGSLMNRIELNRIKPNQTAKRRCNES